MKTILKNKTLNLLAFFAFSIMGLLVFTSQSASAAEITWDGGGSDNNFSTAANWSGDTAPGNGDSIVFPLDAVFSGCPTDLTLINDLDDATVTIAGLSVMGDRPAECYTPLYVDGNTIKTSGNFGTEGKVLYWNTDITATAEITIASITSDNDLAMGTNNVTVSSSRFSGISGSGNLTITKPSAGGGSGGGGCSPEAMPSPFTGDGSGFSGALTISGYAGINVTSRTTDLARYASSITLTGTNTTLGFSTDYDTDLSLNKNITMAGGSLFASQSLDGDCNYAADNSTVNLSGSVSITGSVKVYLYDADLNFTGSVTGKNNLQLQEGQRGSVSFADGSTIDSKMKVVTISDVDDCSSQIYNAGSTANSKLIVNVDCSDVGGTSEEFPYEVRGILAGTGKMGYVKILSGGVVAPGLSPGTLTVANIEWEEGGTYEFEVGKDAADQIKANGTVTLGNGTLEAIRYDGFFPTVGAKYTIIDNDGSDAVSGTFMDLPEGATFTSDGVIYQITYKGGSGNDVVLTVKAVPGVPDTGFGMITNNPIATLGLTTAAGAGILAATKYRAKLANR
jgi:hypothetical protein